MNVIWAQKTGRRVDVAANQHGRVEITDNVFVVLGQGLISERRVHDSEDEDKCETAKKSNMLIHMFVDYADMRDSAISTIWRLIG